MACGYAASANDDQYNWYTFNWCLADPVPTSAPALAPAPGTPSASPTVDSAPTPSPELVVTLYENGGQGVLKLNVTDFTSNEYNDRGGALAWDVCGATSAATTFDNGHELWNASGSNVKELRVNGNWRVSVATECGLTYDNCGCLCGCVFACLHLSVRICASQTRA